MLAIYKRELKALFTSFIAYIFLFIIFLLSGIFFYMTSLSMLSTSLAATFGVLFFVNVIILPSLSMRAFSEDKQQRSDTLLFASPVKLGSIVMGKFLAAYTVFALGLSITIIYAIIMSAYSPVDWSVFFCTIIGMLLTGAAFLSLGIFVSVFTENQFVAFIMALGLSAAWLLIDILKDIFKSGVIPKIVSFLSMYAHYNNFNIGIYSLTSTIFFISFTLIFLFLTGRVLDKRRWG